MASKWLLTQSITCWNNLTSVASTRWKRVLACASWGLCTLRWTLHPLLWNNRYHKFHNPFCTLVDKLSLLAYGYFLDWSLMNKNRKFCRFIYKNIFQSFWINPKQHSLMTLRGWTYSVPVILHGNSNVLGSLLSWIPRFCSLGDKSNPFLSVYTQK